jgi:hypothetical protein
MLRTKIVFFFLLCLTLISCSYIPAVNKEPVFTNFKPESKEYRNKLAEIIRSNPDDLTYVFEKYQYINGFDFLEIKVYGDDIAATALVLVEQKGTSVDGIIEKKGVSYNGAELYGLELDVIDTPKGATFVYKDLDFIID